MKEVTEEEEARGRREEGEESRKEGKKNIEEEDEQEFKCKSMDVYMWCIYRP